MCLYPIFLNFTNFLVYTHVSSGPSTGSTGWQRWPGQRRREARTRSHLWNQLPLGELQQGIWHTRPAGSCKRQINWCRKYSVLAKRWYLEYTTLIINISLFVCLLNSTSTMSTSMEKRKSLCVTGRSAPENRGLSKPSTCWWFICADTQERSHTSALWVSVYELLCFFVCVFFVI